MGGFRCPSALASDLIRDSREESYERKHADLSRDNVVGKKEQDAPANRQVGADHDIIEQLENQDNIERHEESQQISLPRYSRKAEPYQVMQTETTLCTHRLVAPGSQFGFYHNMTIIKALCSVFHHAMTWGPISTHHALLLHA